jgi:hypothetical protein
MRVLCWTSFTFSYLDRARVLFESLRRHHPEWVLAAVITDERPPGFRFEPDDEPFDQLVWGHDIGIPDYEAFLFKHDIVEMCTAVKGPFLNRVCTDPNFAGAPDIAVYLDPDTAVFNRLDPVIERLSEADIVLTPHLAAPELEAGGVADNELSALRAGVYNLGFVAIRTSGEGARFAAWWASRLIEFCCDEVPLGLFTDQRWCDQAPVLFDHVAILRDPGFNVASWNISRRPVAIGHDGQITAGGAPLRFWHFTKLGPVGEAMTRRYARDNHEVYEIWNWYRREIDRNQPEGLPPGWWAHARYEDGHPIPKMHRIAYRSDPALAERFPSPFAGGPASLRYYLQPDHVQPDPPALVDTETPGSLSDV